MKLGYTRAIIDGIHAGGLAEAKKQRDPVFGFDVVLQCPGVPSEILLPRKTWADGKDYDASARKLAQLFGENFKKYADGVSEDVRNAGPVAI
jgi:phosphoenolpyruvate carboxykinase (ATP)